MNRLRGLSLLISNPDLTLFYVETSGRGRSGFEIISLRLRQQGFETNLLQKSFNKFFNRHGLIVVKYGASLREMRLAIQA